MEAKSGQGRGVTQVCTSELVHECVFVLPTRPSSCRPPLYLRIRQLQHFQDSTAATRASCGPAPGAQVQPAGWRQGGPCVGESVRRCERQSVEGVWGGGHNCKGRSPSDGGREGRGCQNKKHKRRTRSCADNRVYSKLTKVRLQRSLDLLQTTNSDLLLWRRSSLSLAPSGPGGGGAAQRSGSY